MKIELTKTEELDGRIWYRVYINGSCERSFLSDASDPDKAFAEASDFYNLLLSRKDQGFPKTETIYSTSK